MSETEKPSWEWRAQLANLNRVYANTVAMLERTNQHLESQRAATYQAVEREHAAKAELAAFSRYRKGTR